MNRERRQRSARENPVEEDSSVVVVDEHEESCIDLTGDDPVVIEGPVELIDLSTPTDVGETTIEVPGTHADGRRNRRTRGSGRRRGPREVRGRARVGQPSGSRTQDHTRANRRRAGEQVNQGAIRIDDDSSGSDSDLPDVELGPGTPYVPDASLNQEGTSSPLQLTCPVCLDDFSKIKAAGRTVMSTKCGHVFCSTCIKSILRQQANMRLCPSCRTKLTQKSVHRIFI